MRKVGRYEIVTEIGRGGMATVYLARQTELGREVALKELSTFHARDPMVASRFVRESRVAASLTHPNIVTVHDYFVEGGLPYIAMEYLERGSLRSYMKRLTLPQVAGVLEGVLAGLAQAESAEIVHRDLKPENLLVASDGGIKIADFGIAKAQRAIGGAAALTATGSTVGTPTYMAPEQAMARDMGPWTDLYSLGVIAYEMLTGRVPFPEEDEPMAVLLHHINDPPPPLRSVDPRIDPRVADWVERLLVKDSSLRARSALEAWDALEGIVIDTLGPRWRRNARLISRVETKDTPDPLTPAPFESTHATPTPQPSQAAAAPSPEPVGEAASEFFTFHRGAEAPPEPAQAPPPAPDGATEAPPPTVPTPPPTGAKPTTPTPAPTGAEPAAPTPAPAGAGKATTPGEVEPASPKSSDFFTFQGQQPPGAPAQPKAPAAPPAGAAAAGAAAPDATIAPSSAAPASKPAPAPATAPATARAEPTTSSQAAAEAAIPRRRPPALPAAQRRWRLLALPAVALLAAGGYLLAPSGDSGDDALPLAGSASSAALELQFPPTFTRASDVPRVQGLKLTDALALRATEAPQTTIVAGISNATGQTLLPSGPLRRAAGDLEPEAVALGRLEALRYDDLRLGGEAARVYAAQTTAGVATLACIGPDAGALAPDCDRIAATLEPLAEDPVALGPSEDYARALNGVLDDLATARDDGRAALGDAGTPGVQADAAAKIGDAYGDGARALAGTDATPADQPVNAKVASALRSAGNAYGSLASAARAGNQGGYDKAATNVTERERGVERSLGALEALGYEIGE